MNNNDSLKKRVPLVKSNSTPFKKVRLFFITISVFVGIILLLMGSIWVTGPYLFALNNHKNILFFSSKIDENKGKIYLAYFFPTTKEIEVMEIDSTPISVLGGYGEYELERVFPLLEMERKKTDFQLAALSWGTEVLIDEATKISYQSKLTNKKELLKQLRIAASTKLVNPEEFVDMWEIFFFTRSVPVEKITFHQPPVKVSDLDILENVMLYEDCSVAVVNTTEKTGLAGKMSEILEKNGVSVVRVADQNSPYQLSTFSFFPDHGSCQPLAERLELLFPGKIIFQQNKQLQLEQRADLVIFIGKDFANLL